MIIQDGLRAMVAEQEDVFYYLTLMNENYPHPAMPDGAEEGILRGMYLLREGRSPRSRKQPRVQLLGSGTILREVLAAAELLEQDCGVLADVWSVTSFTELRRDGIEVERWNMLHPLEEPRQAYVTRVAGRAARAGDRLDRLHPRVRRPDPPVGPEPLPRARHRRLRPQRLPRGAAALLRGRPPLRGGRCARERSPRTARSRRQRVAEAIDRYEIDASAPMPTRAMTATLLPVTVPDIGDFDDVPVIEILVLGRRHGRGRGPAGHARVRQGDDGRARAGGRDGQPRST